MKLKLPDTVSSAQDLASLTLEVKEYARWFSHESIKKLVNIKTAAEAPVMSLAAAELTREWAAKAPLSRQSLEELIATLQHYRDTAPSLTITLAAPPTSAIKKTLVGWCRANIAPNVLVTFQFNATLLGGMVVRYGSHVYDWSFRRQLLDARQRFPEVLRNV